MGAGASTPPVAEAVRSWYDEQVFRTTTSGCYTRWMRLASAVLATALFVVGPSFAGSRLLWHEHGDEGTHGHVIAGLAVADHHDVHHDDDHDHHGQADDGRHGEHEHIHVPHGLLVELPGLTLVSVGTIRVADSVAQLLAWDAARLALHGEVANVAPPGHGEPRAGPTPHGGSGAERILRSSHALLI